MRIAAFLAAGVLSMLAAPPLPAQSAAKPVARPSEQRVREALAALVPAGVVVASVRYDGDRVVLSGTSASNAELSGYLRTLDQSKEFTRVELRVVEVSPPGYRYDAAVSLRCLDEPAPRAGSLCAAPAKSGGVHKCRIDGTLTFQSVPCPPGKEA